MPRLAVSLVAAAAAHVALIGGLGVLGRPKAEAQMSREPFAVAVKVVEARPDPVREEPPALSGPRPPPQSTPPVPPRSAPPRPARSKVAAAAVAVIPTAPSSPAPDPVVVAPSPPSEPPAAPTAPADPVAPAPRVPQVKAVARYRSNPRPDYPKEAKRHHDQGTVKILVAVTADGRAASVALHGSSGSALLDQSALETVAHWTFEPARLDDQPVASSIVVPVTFSLDDDR